MTGNNPIKIFFHIVKLMAIEEWRRNISLFSKWMFVLFPLVVGILSFTTIYLTLNNLDVFSLNDLILFIHFLFAVFGLHSASLAFEKEDDIENLLGDHTTLIFADKTTPLQPKTLIIAYIVKEIILYSLLFAIPIIIALTLIIGNLMSFFYLTITLVSIFSISLGTSLFIISVIHKSKIIGLLYLIVLTGFLILLTYRTNFPSYNYSNLTSIDALISFTIFSILAVILGTTLFKRPEETKTQKNKKSFIMKTWKSNKNIIKYNPKESIITTKTIIDIKRSTGGLGKVLLSITIISLVAILLIEILSNQPEIVPFKLYLLMLITTMGTFTIYLMIHKVDSPTKYKTLPIYTKKYSKGKEKTFYLLSAPCLVTVYILGYLYYNPSIIEVISTYFTFIGVLNYNYSIYYYLTGNHPKEKLYNSKNYGKLSILIFIGFLPLLLIGLFGLLLVTLNQLLIISISTLPILYITSKYFKKKGYQKWKHNFQSKQSSQP